MNSRELLRQPMSSQITRPGGHRFTSTSSSSLPSDALVTYLQSGLRVTGFPNETAESDLERLFAVFRLCKIHWIDKGSCVVILKSSEQVDKALL